MSKVLGVLVAAAFVAMSSMAMAQSQQLSSGQSTTANEAGQPITYDMGPYAGPSMYSTFGD
jgi:hypothetical protein